MTDRPVVVVPTRNAAEGFAALLALDPGLDAAANVGPMTEAARAIQSLVVTEAVRDATIGGRRSSAARPSRSTRTMGSSRSTAIAGSACWRPSRRCSPGFELVTIFYGDGADLAETEAMAADRRDPARRRGRGPARRPAVLPVPDRRRVGGGQGASRSATADRSGRAAGDPARTGPGWPRARRCAGPASGSASTPSATCCSTSPALRRPARDAQARRRCSSEDGDGRSRCRRRSATCGSSPASAAGSSARSPGSRTTRAAIDATWFGRRFIERRLPVGAEVVVSGKIKHFGRRLTFDNPEFQVVDRRDGEVLHAGRIVPVYPLTAGLTAARLRTAIREALDLAGHAYPEYLPDAIAREEGLVPIARAIEEAHYPETFEGRDAALRRLAFDELLALQVGMVAAPAAAGPRRGAGRSPWSRWRTRPSGRRSSTRSGRALGRAGGPDRRPGGGDGRDPRRPGAADADAPPAPGRRRIGQDRGGGLRPRGDGPGRAPGRAPRPDRPARPPAPRDGGRAARGCRDRRDAADRLAQGRREGQGARGDRVGPGAGRRRDPRPDPGGGLVRRPRPRRSSTSSTASGSTSAASSRPRPAVARRTSC